MKKIIFINIPMKELPEKNKISYAHSGNTNYHYSEKVYYPITTVMADKIRQDDEIKVVSIKTKTENDDTDTNERKLQSELKVIADIKRAHIQYECIEAPFVETHKNNEIRLQKLLQSMEQDAEIYADITFGQKSLPMLLMCALNFAEKFFNANIRNIIYGKVEFAKDTEGNPILTNPELYDVTSLYYLNNLVGAMKASSGFEALKNLEQFFLLSK